MLAGGAPLKETLCEMSARATGTCRGKGGRMHISAPEAGVMVTTGIVGAGLPHRQRPRAGVEDARGRRVTFVNFGDGATNIGARSEALNMAAIWDLPVVSSAEQPVRRVHAAPGVPAVREHRRPRGFLRDARRDGRRQRRDRDLRRRLRRRGSHAEGRGHARGVQTPSRLMGHYFGEGQEYMPANVMAAAVAADPVPASASSC